MTTSSFGENALILTENQVDPGQNTAAQAPRRRVKRRTWQTVIWFVALLALTAVVLYPLVWLFLSTFKPNAEFGQNMGLLPNNPTLENYVKVSEGIAGVPMQQFFLNSLIIAVGSVIGTVLSSVSALATRVISRTFE